MRYLAISFDPDGTKFMVMQTAKEAYDWLDHGPNLSGSCKIFQFDGELFSMYYDSYGETHVTSSGGEAEVIYDEDSTSVNVDELGLSK
jgi:hypothetical protein